MDSVEQLRTENARLREALRWIISEAEDGCMFMGGMDDATLAPLKAALEGDE